MQKRKKRGHNWFAYILGIVVLICLGIVAQQEYKIYQLKQEKAATEARIDALTEKHANLEAERKKLDDPKYFKNHYTVLLYSLEIPSVNKRKTKRPWYFSPTAFII